MAQHKASQTVLDLEGLTGQRENTEEQANSSPERQTEGCGTEQDFYTQGSWPYFFPVGEPGHTIFFQGLPSAQSESPNYRGPPMWGTDTSLQLDQ